MGRGRGGNERGVYGNGPTGNNREKSAGKTGVNEGGSQHNDFSDPVAISNPVNAKPPHAPSLLPKSAGGAEFTLPKQPADTRQELKLSIEFPLSRGKSGNDIALFFKRFMSILFACGTDIQLLKWEGGTENPIMAAGDIAYDEETIGQYYSGMKLQGNKNRMIGYSRIMTSDTFSKIKRNTRLFDWLQTNRVWVKPTILSSSKHVKIGWLLRSHPSYTNFPRATSDLIKRIGVEGIEIELSPHALSHTTTDGHVLRTRALKVVTTEEHGEAVLEGLIDALTGPVPDEFSDSTTAAFKLVPFNNSAITRDGVAELVERQNDFLHRTTATSVVDMGDGDEWFSDEATEGDNVNEADGETMEKAEGSLRIWAMSAKTEEGKFLFHSVEPGRKGQCFFLHEKSRLVEAEEWLDNAFNGLLHEYGAGHCRSVLKGEGHVRREKNVKVSPKIAEYLKGLDLQGLVADRVRDDHLRAPPPKKSKAGPRIRYGPTEEGGVWGALSTPRKMTGGPIDNCDLKAVNVDVVSPAPRHDTQSTQETLDSTVSDLQSSLQQEVERANRLRKVAAEASEKSLMEMQMKVDSRLEAMDQTIKGVHEGQTLNDQNINIMMTKMDIFGRQMQRMEEKFSLASPPRKRSSGDGGATANDEENEWVDDSDPSPAEFDAIMSDAEAATKKRVAEMASAKTAKKTKSLLSTKTRSQSGRTR